MITKKLMHDIQTWLNSLYDFQHPNNKNNKHLITNLENFLFKFISIRVAIWSIDNKGIIDTCVKSFTDDIYNKEGFLHFKSFVEKNIKDYLTYE